MRYVFTIMIAVFVALSVPAYGSCPNVSGPFFLGPYYWYEWDWATSCAGTTGSVSTSTLSCFSDPAYQFTGSSGTVTYSYTVGASDPVVDTTKWQVTQFFDFNDPNNWSRELGDPRYVLDLLARIVTVSLETVQIVDGLPALAVRKSQ